MSEQTQRTFTIAEMVVTQIGSGIGRTSPGLTSQAMVEAEPPLKPAEDTRLKAAFDIAAAALNAQHFESVSHAVTILPDRLGGSGKIVTPMLVERKKPTVEKHHLAQEIPKERRKVAAFVTLTERIVNGGSLEDFVPKSLIVWSGTGEEGSQVE